MSDRPNIFVLEHDFDRLSAMLEKQPHGNETAEALSLELDRATLVEVEKLPSGTVTMNSLVHFKNEGNDAEHTLRLVYPTQREVGEECVSVLAPAGAALLGLRVGDRIDWPLVGKKTLSLRIIHVTNAN
ncbi:nucleoside diphosphate kinase regulator [Marinobacter oulmenensis]|uniref:Regulator of nucleoside diphosphate kinase n=1 Tax=Marinobacter oulmenensis TaxID=643747 RepID=A0A840U2X7_9GAMM|nr:nucleoside diphosphate kinase regulator [Marinobacter oulmenensis]MBB5320064.1 regulator of nucleoside diphosphate kinase [Marinobacter oulmenensis]